MGILLEIKPLSATNIYLLMKTQISKYLTVLTTFVATLCVFATNAFATDVETTNEVAKEKTITRWFFWPGWAFGGLVTLVLVLAFLFYWKNVLGPKKRGRKIS